MEGTSLCPNCQSPVQPDDRFCGDCGEPRSKAVAGASSDAVPAPHETAPLRLEVKLGRQLKEGAHGVLDVRVTNQTRDALQGIELEIESSLTLLERADFLFDTPAKTDVLLYSTFSASQAGQHYFSFRIQLDRDDVFEARFGLEVSSPAASTQIINFTDARRIEGRVVVGTEGTQLSMAPAVPEESVQSNDFMEVLLRLKQKVSTGRLKRPLSGFEDAHYKNDRLLLQVHRSGGSSNIGLLATRSVELGKDRRKDIVIRVYPPSAENDERTLRISSTHARIAFVANGAEFHDKSTNGTRLAGHRLARGESSLLSQGTEIRLADVLSLGCELFYGDVGEVLSSSRQFADRYVGATVAEPVGPLRAVRLRRLDNLPGVEEYVIFQHVVSVGSGPACEIQIDDPSVSPTHAQILWLGNSLWLEALQTKRVTLVDGQEIPRHRLVPLRPNLPLQFGDVEVTVSDFRQRYLDM